MDGFPGHRVLFSHESMAFLKGRASENGGKNFPRRASNYAGNMGGFQNVLGVLKCQCSQAYIPWNFVEKIGVPKEFFKVVWI